MNVFRKFFSVGYMVKPEYQRGEIIRSKEAYKNLISIAVPSIIEMVFVSLIGSVDVIMVGRLGYRAVAAVGLSSYPRYIMQSLFIALNVGVTAIVARRKGEESPDRANQTVRNALVLTTILTAAVTALTLVFSRQILLVAGAQPDTIDTANDFFRIITCFLPVNTITMCINAAQRGVGDTRTTMVANLAANIFNIFFDYLLIYGNWGFPKLGVVGDAWGSGIGICVGLILSVAALITGKGGSRFLRISFKDNWRLSKETVKSILKIGGNTAVEQVAQSVGFFIFGIVVANLGTEAFAALQVGNQFITFSFNFGSGLAVAAVSLVGQMLGKKRPDLAIVYAKCAQRLALFISIGLAACIAIFRGPLVGVFLDRSDSANVLAAGMAVDIMLVIALIQPPQTSSMVYAGCLRGSGDNFYVAVSMIICVAVVRPLFSFLAVNAFGFGIIGAWGAAFCDTGLRFILTFRRFSGPKWHNKKV